MNLVPVAMAILAYKLSKVKLTGNECWYLIQPLIALTLIFLLILGNIIYSGIFIEIPILNRERRQRYLMNAYGVQPIIYWIGLLLVDLLIFIFPVILVGFTIYFL